MRVGLGLLLLLLLVTVLGAPDAEADLCQDPRIVAEAQRQEPTFKNPIPFRPECRAQAFDFRDSEGSHQIEIAWVLRDAAWDYDVIATRYDAFGRLPNGEILDLERFRAVPAPSGQAEWHVLEGLGIDAARAGGTCCIRFDLFFDYALERRGNRLCVVYYMKSPFSGSFLDCDGYEDAVGTVGYMDGSVSWDQARDISCQQAATDSGKPCAHNVTGPLDTRLKSDSDGTLYWVTRVRTRIRAVTELATPTSTPVHYEEREYRVDLVGGKVTLLRYEDQPVPGEKLQE